MFVSRCPGGVIGTYSKFVETNKTGLLQTFYDPQAIANFVVELDVATKTKFLFQTSKSYKKCNFAPQRGQKLLRFRIRSNGNFKTWSENESDLALFYRL